MLESVKKAGCSSVDDARFTFLTPDLVAPSTYQVGIVGTLSPDPFFTAKEQE